jgi:hypothetical protein
LLKKKISLYEGDFLCHTDRMKKEKYTLVDGGLTIETKLSLDDPEPYPLFIDATAVGRTDDFFEREQRARRILELLDESNIDGRWHSGEEGNASATIAIGFQQRGYGVYGMTAELDWPDLSDEAASRLASTAMRHMARAIGLHDDVSERELRRRVYASVSRQSGITLETNPAASSSMDTDGMEYTPGGERASLYSHNLYTHSMQLVCISGIIALARAR